MTPWETEATTKLRGFFATDAATSIVVAMLAALRTVQRIQRGKTDDTMPQDALRMLFTLSIAVYESPFLQAHGGKLLPLYQAGVMGWLDGARYLAELGKLPEGERGEKHYKLAENAQACARLYREFAIHAMMAEKGAAAALSLTVPLREALDELMER